MKNGAVVVAILVAVAAGVPNRATAAGKCEIYNSTKDYLTISVRKWDERVLAYASRHVSAGSFEVKFGDKKLATGTCSAGQKRKVARQGRKVVVLTIDPAQRQVPEAARDAEAIGRAAPRAAAQDVVFCGFWPRWVSRG